MTPEALSSVFEQQRPKLLKVAHTIVRNEATAEEVVQDAFLNIFEGGQWKDGIHDLPRWLTTAVQNAAKDRLKADRRRYEQEENFVARQPAAIASERIELRADLEAALMQLPPELREAVLAVSVRGETEREYAASAGVAPSIAHKRVQQGLEMLRQGRANGPSASSQASEETETDEEAA